MQLKSVLVVPVCMLITRSFFCSLDFFMSFSHPFLPLYHRASVFHYWLSWHSNQKAGIRIEIRRLENLYWAISVLQRRLRSIYRNKMILLTVFLIYRNIRVVGKTVRSLRYKLEECRTLWGEPERVHVQNMEQLHAYDHCQNVTEHKHHCIVHFTMRWIITQVEKWVRPS